MEAEEKIGTDVDSSFRGETGKALPCHINLKACLLMCQNVAVPLNSLT